MKINTRKQAIDEKCKDCIYDSLSGGSWRMQVESCLDNKCALFYFRPLTQDTIIKNRQEKYNNMTDKEKEKADKKSEETRERFKK